MRITCKVTAPFDVALKGRQEELAAGITKATGARTLEMRDSLRGEADRNFRRVAGTRSVSAAIRARSYPQGGRASLGPAGVVAIPWRLADVFASGVTIAGRPWLAIPSIAAIRAGFTSEKVNGRRQSDVAAAVAELGAENLHILPSGGNLVIATELGSVSTYKEKAVFRNRNLKLVRRQYTVLFTLVPRVTLAPRLSLQKAADTAAAGLASDIGALGDAG